MSFAVDVNVLLYASDASAPQHEAALGFLRDCALGSETFCLAWPTILGYLRIATHPAIFERPLTPRQAEDNVAGLLGMPHVRVLSEEDGFWEAYREATRGQAVRGNLVPDAHLAALLLQHGIQTLYTSDAGLRRFAFLDVRDPLA